MTYKLAFVVCLIVLGNLWNNDCLARSDDASIGLEEDERMWWWRSTGLLDCVQY